MNRWTHAGNVLFFQKWCKLWSPEHLLMALLNMCKVEQGGGRVIISRSKHIIARTSHPWLHLTKPHQMSDHANVCDPLTLQCCWPQALLERCQSWGPCCGSPACWGCVGSCLPAGTVNRGALCVSHDHHLMACHTLQTTQVPYRPCIVARNINEIVLLRLSWLIVR